MHFVCKLDRKLYGVVTKDIASDDVVITEERIEHIKEHHPNDFETFADFFVEIINDPDYILAGNTERTFLLLKEIHQKNRPVKLILRLKTFDDPAEYKNSILTFTRTDKKRMGTLNQKEKNFLQKNSLRWWISSEPHADGTDKALSLRDAGDPDARQGVVDAFGRNFFSKVARGTEPPATNFPDTESVSVDRQIFLENALRYSHAAFDFKVAAQTHDG